MFTVIALVFFLVVSCGSRQQVPEPDHDDETVEKQKLPIDDQFALGVEYYELLEDPASDGVPAFIRNTVRNAPEDAILGIGIARRQRLTVSRSIATTKAREDISRQLEIITRDMVTDYLDTYGTDPQTALAFLNRGDITWDVPGISIIDEAMADDGYYWVLVTLSRNNIARTIELHAAELIPSGNAAMWSTARLDVALERNNLAFRAQHGFN